MSDSRHGQTRRPLARIHFIHEEIAAGRWPNCSSLAQKLEVSTKTVQRDLIFMRDEFELPLEFVSDHNGYHYTKPVEAFPSFKVGVEELMALFVARKVLAPMTGTVVAAALTEGFNRLAEQASGQVPISWTDLDRGFSVQENGVMPADLHQIELLSAALVNHRKLFFRYTNAKDNQTKARTVRPLHLAQVKGGWYLFAWDEGAGDIRIFALPRMHELEILKEKFTGPTDFNLDDYLKGSMSLITSPEAPEQKVVIRFSGYAATLVSERTWHSSQKVKRSRDGTVQLTLRLQQLDNIPGWVLSWAGMAEVLSPVALRKEVAKQARKIGRMHQGDAPADHPAPL
jgi:predicted DNA-binding transcriptional regulator YafY